MARPEDHEDARCESCGGPLGVWRDAICERCAPTTEYFEMCAAAQEMSELLKNEEPS
jgi:hypothetical protein